MLEKLINTALLGTDKLSFDENLLPVSIQEALKNINVSDKEARFLKTAALITVYQDAGSLPSRFLGVLPTENIAETLPFASEKLSSVVNDIAEVQYHLRTDLFDLWFDTLITRQELIHPRFIVPLLDLESAITQKFRTKILKIIGNRGLQLLAFKADWNKWQIIDETQIWAEGRLAERRAYFTELRQINPQKALELLQVSWPQESLTDKKAFLEVIKGTFQVNDIPFLENTLTAFIYTAKERKGQTECRATITELLLRNAETAFYKSTTAWLNNYFQTEKGKGVLSWAMSKENKIINLAAQEDEHWNEANMNVLYGFEKSPDAAFYPNNQVLWLANLIENLPFDYWMKALDKDLEKTLSYFMNEPFTVVIERKKQAILLNHLIKNAQNHSNMALSKAIMSVTKSEVHQQLLVILPLEEKEKYILENKHLTNIIVLEACFEHWKGTWSADFSRKILVEVWQCHVSANPVYLTERIGVLMARCIDSSAIDLLNSMSEIPTNASQYHVNHWQKFFANAIKKTIEIKQKITT